MPYLSLLPLQFMPFEQAQSLLNWPTASKESEKKSRRVESKKSVYEKITRVMYSTSIQKRFPVLDIGA